MRNFELNNRAGIFDTTLYDFEGFNQMQSREHICFVTEFPFRGRVKITRCVDVDRRLAELQHGNCNWLDAVSFPTDNARQWKQAIMNLLVDHCIHGDWYEVDEAKLEKLTILTRLGTEANCEPDRVLVAMRAKTRVEK